MEKDSLKRFVVGGFVMGRYVRRSFVCLRMANTFFNGIRNKKNFSIISLYDYYDEDHPNSFKVLRVCFG